MIKRVFTLLIIGVVFYLSWIAYERVDRSNTWSLSAEVKAKSERIAALEEQLANAKLAKDKLHEAMLICFPGAKEQINSAFGVPTTQPAESQPSSAPTKG